MSTEGVMTTDCKFYLYFIKKSILVIFCIIIVNINFSCPIIKFQNIKVIWFQGLKTKLPKRKIFIAFKLFLYNHD